MYSASSFCFFSSRVPCSRNNFLVSVLPSSSSTSLFSRILFIGAKCLKNFKVFMGKSYACSLSCSTSLVCSLIRMVSCLSCSFFCSSNMAGVSFSEAEIFSSSSMYLSSTSGLTVGWKSKGLIFKKAMVILSNYITKVLIFWVREDAHVLSICGSRYGQNMGVFPWDTYVNIATL